MQTIDHITIFGQPDAGALNQAKTCLKTAEKVCLMADNHKGYAVPIGGVVAYKDAISPSGVGFDIACGNKAVLTDAYYSDIRDSLPKIMDDIVATIRFGVGRARIRDQFKSPHDHPLFDDPAWKISAISPLRDLARSQLGTVGSGNHYVDIFRDEQDRIWVGVHFGSRGFGHKTATHFLKAAGAKDGMDVAPCVIPTTTDMGTEYLECMRLAGVYTYAGRDWVCSRVAAILGANILNEVHNHHNFAWLETHNGEQLWVVRKGATPAFPGQRGFVGGSMGDMSVILEGVDSPESKAALYSTVHGAGRVMSRTEAAGKKRWARKDGGRKANGIREGGKISREMMMEWVHKAGVELRGAGVDESPQCYKRLPDVLAAHGGTIRILHTLRPIGVAMAGENEFDPYKD